MKMLSLLLLLGSACTLTPIYADESDGDMEADKEYNKMVQQAQHGDTQQYDERRKEYRHDENGNLIRRDDAGDDYVIPWSESNEYYGNPPPQVLDEPAQNQNR